MLPTAVKKNPLLATLLLLCAALIPFAWRASADNREADGLSSEKVNLALRRTAHGLLTAAGDDTSRIAPVEQTRAGVWLIRLERSFNYDTLPRLLQAAFELHGIRANYDVAVLRCADGKLQLGYNFLDFSQNDAVPCGGRYMEPGCYNLQVSFPESTRTNGNFPGGVWIFLLGAASTAFIYTLIRKTRRRRLPAEVQQPATLAADWLHFGNSRLDFANQILFCGPVRHQLTYREAKLLQLFAARPNQLLERNFILENVWADEGILVGRSIDVFVSRLRKMLRDDPSVGIAAVHGVGYRMEVEMV